METPSRQEYTNLTSGYQWEFPSFRAFLKPFGDFFRWVSNLCGNHDNKPITLLFVGMKDVGKTTAIKSLSTKLGQNLPDDSDELNNTGIFEEHSFKIWKYAYGNKPLTFIEAPSFGSAGNDEYNAKTVTALNKYLETFSKPSIPGVVFITASLTDNRLAGPNSSFSNMLNCLKYLGNKLTTASWSNSVLLLTHSDKADVVDTVTEREVAYKKQFKEILGVEPSYTFTVGQKDGNIIVDNSNWLQYIQGILLKQVGWGRQNGSQLKSKEFSSIDIDSLRSMVPPSLIAKMMSKDYDGKDIFNDAINFFPREFHTESKHNGEWKIEDSDFFQTDTSGKIYNLVGASSKIILADNSEREAKMCSIGDRVIGHNKVGVITNLCKVRRSNFTNGSRRAITVSKIYLVAKQTTSRYIKYNQRFHFTNEVSSNDWTGNDLIYVEVDEGQGTFVVNGYVRKCIGEII